MTLVKWTPRRNMLKVFDDVENMMHQAFGNSFQNNNMLTYSPLMNVSERKSNYFVMMDLPGVLKKDVEVNISNGILTISGERKTTEEGDNNNPIWNEASYGTFSRSFELTSDISENKINAKFSNGVLNITIPKVEKVKPTVKKIAVS